IRDFHVTGVQTCALPIYQRLSEVAIKRNETESAYEYLRKANNLDPANPSVAYNLSMVAISLQAYQFADSVVRIALEDDSVNINQIGRASCREGGCVCVGA